MDKIIINSQEYELETLGSFDEVHDNTPVVLFNCRKYIGKAIKKEEIEDKYRFDVTAGIVGKRTPLFHADNGKVPIYEGDTCWIVGDAWDIYESVNLLGQDKFSTQTFSTEKLAIEYVLMNKPLNLSVQQLMDRLHAYFKNPLMALENLNELAKKKMNL